MRESTTDRTVEKEVGANESLATHVAFGNPFPTSAEENASLDTSSVSVISTAPRPKRKPKVDSRTYETSSESEYSLAATAAKCKAKALTDPSSPVRRLKQIRKDAIIPPAALSTCAKRSDTPANAAFGPYFDGASLDLHTGNVPTITAGLTK